MKIGVSPDSTCGGVPVTPSQSFFTIKGKPVIRNGDVVPPHSVHSVQTIISSRFFTCQGIPVAAVGDLATCTDVVTGGEFATVQG